MPSIEVELSPPALWQDFERLTLDYARRIWGDPGAARNGRQGQSQAGVDVYGTNNDAKEFTGIQCKKKVNATAPSKRLTASEIDREIECAKSFAPKLDRFIIATTGPRDGDLQEHVRKVNGCGLPFHVGLLFWDEYQEFLNNHVDMLDRYYRDIVDYRRGFGADVHYLLLVQNSFERAALRTPFHCENSVSNFIKAISDTCNAISTGRQVDLRGNVIDEVRPPSPKLDGAKKALRFLQKVRDTATEAAAAGLLLQEENWIVVRSTEISKQLNSLRQQAIDALNVELRRRGLEELDFSLRS